MALVPCLHSSPMYSGLALSICKCVCVCVHVCVLVEQSSIYGHPME